MPKRTTATSSRSSIEILVLLRKTLDNCDISGPRASVARAVLADPDKAQYASSRAIAKTANTHVVAVTRLCQSLGFAGWKAFQNLLRLQIASDYRQRANLPPDQQVESNDDRAQVVSKVAMASETRVQMVIEDLIPAIKKVLPILSIAQRIDCYGFGGSAPIAFDAQHKLLRLHIPGTTYDDPHMQAMSVPTLDENTVVLAFSNTGETAAIVKATAAARQAGAKVIAVAPRLSSLVRESEYALLVPQNLPESLFNPLYSRIGHTVLVDILATLLYTRRLGRKKSQTADKQSSSGGKAEAADTKKSPPPDFELAILQQVRKALKGGKLTQVQTQVAQAILADPARSAQSTGKEAAKWAGTNQAQITRMCQRLGFTGWPQFSRHLQTELHAYSQEVELGYHPLKKRPQIARVLQDVKLEVCTRIKALTGGLSHKLGQLLPLLDKAGRIDCYGFGGSAPIASDARYKLFRIGVEGASYSDPTMVPMSAVMLKDCDVVLAFSLSGETSSIVEAAKTARQAGATVIAISPADTALASASTHHIHVAGDAKTSKHSPRYSRVAHTVLIDIITILLAQRQGAEGEERLQRIVDSQRWLRTRGQGGLPPAG